MPRLGGKMRSDHRPSRPRAGISDERGSAGHVSIKQNRQACRMGFGEETRHRGNL